MIPIKGTVNNNLPSHATANSFSSTLGSDDKMNNQFSYIKNSKQMFIIKNNSII